MRMINDFVSHQLLGDGYSYFVYYAGDEILLTAKNDNDAIIEGANLIEGFERYSGNKNKIIDAA